MEAGIDYIVYVLLTPVAVFLLFLPIREVWQYRAKPITRALILYLMATAAFFLGNTIEILLPSERGVLFWVVANHMFFLAIASTWVMFALAYVGLEHVVLSRKRFALFIMPLTTLVMILTNPQHGIFWIEFVFFRSGPFLTGRGVPGPWFWINGVYVYVLLVSGVVIVSTGLGVTKPIYSRQSGIVVLGSVLPIVLNLSYVFDLVPWLNKDFTAVGFTLSGLAFYVGVHRYGLIRVTPIPQRFVLEDIQSGVLVIEPEGHLTECNFAAEVMLGLSHTELIAKHWSSIPELAFFIQDVRLEEKSSFESSREGGSVTEFFQVWISPIRLQTGRFAGTVVTVHDVTERMHLIENRNKALTELEQRTQRMHELQLALLRQERLASVGQLAAGLAHDLNNPLTFMRSGFVSVEQQVRRLLSLVPDDKLPSDERDELSSELVTITADFENGFRRIRELLHSLMRLSHPSDDNEYEQADINEILESTLTLVSPALNGKATVHRHFASDLPSLCCLRGHLGSVFLNLILNALHAIEAEYDRGRPYPGEITILTRRSSFGVYCSVQDSGSGVALEQVDRVFEPFFTTKAAGKGTGLGLSISRDIVENRHGGRLYVDPQSRNTFIVELPLTAEDSEPAGVKPFMRPPELDNIA